jgi:histidyl-tRNA synthetase
LINQQDNFAVVPVSDVYAVIPSSAALPLAVSTIERLRQRGVKVQMHAATSAGMGSMKSQFKKADASGAFYALVFGEDEALRGAVTIKSLRDGSGTQVERSLDAIADWSSTLQSTR